jgi:adenosine 3'-phospho 5'-phosphosulfate transporter B2
MGRILKGTSYSFLEYLEASLITLGVMLFSLSKNNWVVANPQYEFIGIVLLVLYVLSDSFTSQWQSRIYRDHGSNIDHFQMMFGVNVSSIAITSIALVLSGEIPILIEFFSYNPGALYYNIITSITSASGQFFVFYTVCLVLRSHLRMSLKFFSSNST